MNWLQDIVMFCAVMGMIQWIVPSGTYEKYIKWIISILTLAVILSPLSRNDVLPAGLLLPIDSVTEADVSKVPIQTEALDTVQDIQIQELLKEKIRSQIFSALKGKVSGINEEDIEVYIEQMSWKDGGHGTCLVTIETMDETRHEELRAYLHEKLDLNGIEITFKSKKAGETVNES